MNKYCGSGQVFSEYLKKRWERCLIKVKAQVKPWLTLGLAESLNKLWPQIKIWVGWKNILGYVSSRLCPFRFESLLGCVHSSLRFSTGRPIETLPQSAKHSWTPPWEIVNILISPCSRLGPACLQSTSYIWLGRI